MRSDGPLRSWLFTPGDRPDRFGKAITSGADAVILDLEDAVAPERRPEARTRVLEFLATADRGRTRIAVRINALASVAGLRDLAALAGLAKGGADIVVAPKIEYPADLAVISHVLDDAGSPAQLVALIETPRGMARAHEIADATPRLIGLLYGAADYAATLGLTAEQIDSGWPRAQVANAAAIAGLIAIDTPQFAIGDPTALAADCAAAARAGLQAKAAIHPTQIAAINAAFTPSDRSLAQARQLLEAGHEGAVQIDGRMADAAMLRWARRVVHTG